MGATTTAETTVARKVFAEVGIAISSLDKTENAGALNCCIPRASQRVHSGRNVSARDASERAVLPISRNEICFHLRMTQSAAAKAHAHAL
jgi:hypothetical protein